MIFDNHIAISIIIFYLQYLFFMHIQMRNFVNVVCEYILNDLVLIYFIIYTNINKHIVKNGYYLIYFYNK